MSSSKAKMQSWAMGQIEEAFPPADSLSAIDDLYRVEHFLAGETPLLFGMKTVPDAFEDPMALVERARAGLLRWFEHLGETGDHAGQAKLYPTVRAFAPSVPEPAIIREQRAVAEADERAKQSALAGIPRPMEAIRRVSASLAATLARLRDGRPDDFFETYGEELTAACGLARFAVLLGNFQWHQEEAEPLDPEWDSLLDSFEPPFFPFAGPVMVGHRLDPRGPQVGSFELGGDRRDGHRHGEADLSEAAIGPVTGRGEGRDPGLDQLSGPRRRVGQRVVFLGRAGECRDHGGCIRLRVAASRRG